MKSLPARFGRRRALTVSSLTHAVTFALFVVFGRLEGFGPVWYAGLAVTAAVFLYEHQIVTPTDLSRVNRAFFTANGFLGLALFAFAAVDLLGRGLHP